MVSHRKQATNYSGDLRSEPTTADTDGATMNSGNEDAAARIGTRVRETMDTAPRGCVFRVGKSVSPTEHLLEIGVNTNAGLSERVKAASPLTLRADVDCGWVAQIIGRMS
jgi:hypothetical protein